jgi:tetratricopeptide (TPR) repeat protein
MRDPRADGVSVQGLPSDACGLDPQTIIGGGRYRVLDQLGRGGMARVYRAYDSTAQREVALKSLLLPEQAAQHRTLTAMFEREYHTLAQLAHPRVVEVYDYGIDASGPYYTMELLDSGDLRERSPMKWRTACELSFDVCSALALIHSRRLVHRDVSPRNVRCTSTNRVKLIDFGALAPVGPSSQIVGTPSFIAPETLDGATLDARTDLYSLGATLYFALTGRAAYPARVIADLAHAWRARPAPPSTFASDVPAELDALVMALLNIDPSSRPSSAFEVMQRLASIANLDRNEPASVSRAYLVTPTLQGREDLLSIFLRQLELALAERGSGFLVEAGRGLGRSRLLDACVVEAKTAGATVLRASASEGRFAVARALSQHLIDACPQLALSVAREEHVVETLFEVTTPSEPADSPDRVSLRSWNSTPAEELALQTALARWFLAVSHRHPLVIVIDDVDRVDPGSLALLAALAHRAPSRRLLVCATAVSCVAGNGSGLEILSSHCKVVTLRPLTAAETEALLTSLFSDAANLSLLSARVHALARGRPRECIALAQHLVDSGLIRYASGSWTLPEQLTDADLPESMDAVFRERVRALSLVARRLGQAQALATYESFTAEDYAQLAPEVAPQLIHALIAELVTNEITSGDGRGYVLAHEAIRGALLASLEETERHAQHRALAELYLRKGTSQLAAVRHMLAAGAAERALELFGEVLSASSESNELVSASQMTVPEIAQVLVQAHDAALILGWKPRPLNELRRWVLLHSSADPNTFNRIAPLVLSQLEHDCGLEFYRNEDDAQAGMQRLTNALQRANEQYAATPEHARVYRVEEAIKHLVNYCVASIAVGANTLNVRLLATLPGLLEPFAPLSPLLRAIWQNTLATIESLGLARPENARARWVELYAQLSEVNEQQLRNVTLVRNAVAFGVGALEAQLGLESAANWAEILDREPTQRVSAMYLRKTVCMLRGDFAGAESFRRKAEVLGLQASATQMFANLAAVELSVHAAARDLIGVKRIRDRIVSLASKHLGWRVYEHLADAVFQRLRGDLAGACEAFELAMPLCEPNAADTSRVISAWPRVTSGYIETLVERGQYAEAQIHGEQALDKCREHGIGISRFEIERAVALVEAKLNDHTAAAARLERLIAAQRELGLSGLNLGLSYEARARIAIWAGDHTAVETYTQLTAGQYRPGRASSLGARYERLMLEARAAGIRSLRPADDALAHFTSPQLGNDHVTVATTIGQMLDAIENSDERARQALQMLCEAHGGTAGHLYVMRKQGLVHAASHAALSPSAMLTASVMGFWNDQLESGDMATAFVSDDGSHEVSLHASWTDSADTSWRPVLLQCMAADAHRHVGVLVVTAARSVTSPMSASEAAVAVAEYFIRTGVAIGVGA